MSAINPKWDTLTKNLDLHMSILEEFAVIHDRAFKALGILPNMVEEKVKDSADALALCMGVEKGSDKPKNLKSRYEILLEDTDEKNI